MPNINVIAIEQNSIRLKTIPNTMEALRDAVGGHCIKVVPLDEQLCVICNAWGKAFGLPPVALIPARHDVLFGPLVICRITSGGKFADVAEEDLRTVDDSLLLITHVCGGAKTDD